MGNGDEPRNNLAGCNETILGTATLGVFLFNTILNKPHERRSITDTRTEITHTWER